MRIVFTTLIALIYITNLFSQTKTKYPDIPRIDVHTHVANDYNGIHNYLDLRQYLLNEFDTDLAIWINVGDRSAPFTNPDSASLNSDNRMLCTFFDYSPQKGFNLKPEDLQSKIEEGFIGFKIWYGPWYRVLKEGEKGYKYVNDPANDPIFSAMEEYGILATSIHIADPNGPFGNRQKWLADPVEYWTQITSFYNLLGKYPKLQLVGAHSLWLICQDAQIDYLRFLLKSYPNLNIDLAATFQYFNLVNHDNLRDFIIEYADRILFGTDNGTWKTDEETKEKAKVYNNCFRILETNELVEGSFFGNEPTKGLNLPQEVLEKIYYKNAVRIYPKVGEKMKMLGY